jgi:hypothetical protein
VATPGGRTPYNPFSPTYNGDTAYYIGSNLIWSPVKGLDIGVEVLYSEDVLQHKEFDTNSGAGKLVKSAPDWLGRLRIHKDF